MQAQNQVRLARGRSRLNLFARAAVHDHAPDARQPQERLLLEQSRDTEDGLTANLYWCGAGKACLVVPA